MSVKICEILLRGTRRAARFVGALALIATALVVGVPDQTVRAAIPDGFSEQPPERLYMLPKNPFPLIPEAALGFIVPASSMLFIGQDLISMDDREIVLDFDDSPAGTPCKANVDAPVGQADYDVTNCTSIRLLVSHGRLSVGPLQERFKDDAAGVDNPALPVYLTPSGAQVFLSTDDEYNADSGVSNLLLNGTKQQLNDALKLLTYTPDPDGNNDGNTTTNDFYRYDGSNPETLDLLLTIDESVTPAPPDLTLDWDVDIRVLDLNDWPELDGANEFGDEAGDGPANQSADTGIEKVIPGTYSLSDVDNDELIDGEDDDDPDGNDGAGDDMMLIGYLDCGTDPDPLTDTGFHFSSASYASGVTTIDSALNYMLGLGNPPMPPLVPPAEQAEADAYAQKLLVKSAFLTALEATPIGSNTGLTSAGPVDYGTFFVGVTEIDQVQVAIENIYFKHDIENDSCDMLVIVSDLGNNGLPLQYVSDPDFRQYGVEFPAFGFDWDEFTIETGELQEITIDFDSAAPIFVSESDLVRDVVAPLRITPGNHPEFDIVWTAIPRAGDPAVPGLATLAFNGDFSSLTDFGITIPAGAETVPPLGEVFPEAPYATVFDDSDPEPTETFTLNLVIDPADSPDGWKVVSNVPSRTVVIKDDDGGPGSGDITAAIADTSVTEGDSGITSMEFTVDLTGAPATGYETIDYTVSAGSADPGVDYDPTPGTVTFSPNATSAIVTVPIIGDYHVESNETLTVELSNPNGLALDSTADTATGTITNDDQPSVVSILPTSIPEGSTGPVTVSMTNPTGHTCNISITTTNGTAENGDYTPLINAPLTLDGVVDATIDLVTVADADADDDTVSVDFVLTPNTDCQYGSRPATVTITEPPPPGTITAAVTGVAVDEGDTGATDMEFTVTLSGGPAVGGETIDYATSDGTATTAGNDYTATSGTYTFEAGDTEATIVVPITGDHRVEGNETLKLTLSDASGVLLIPNPAPATGTITNDDQPSVVSILPTSILEGSTGPITVSMTNPTGHTCNISITTTNGTAENGDYTPLVNAPLALNGVATNTINLATFADADTDADTVSVDFVLTPNTDCQYGSRPATVTITEPPPDDPEPDPLTITTPANIVQPNDPGQAGAVVTWAAPTTTGGTPPVVVTCVPAAGSYFPLGTTTVACSATDSEPAPVMELASGPSSPVAAALTAASTFTVTVVDNEPPTIADLPDLVRATPNGPVPVTFPLPDSSDNSGVAPTVTCVDPSGTFFAVGVTMVTCTATDGAGNSASSTFTVTVVLDATAPVPPQQGPTPAPAPTGPTIPPGGELPATGGTPGRLLLTAVGLVFLGVILRQSRRPGRA